VGLGKELLELVVLGFKLSKLCSVGRLHAAKAGAPLVEGWLAKATGPAKFLDGHARVSLFEEANDLLIGKSGLFHSRYSPKLADFVPSLWYGRQGAGHKYERVYLRAYDSVSDARTDIAQYISWYNSERGHSSLGDKTPEQVWLSNLQPLREAA